MIYGTTKEQRDAYNRLARLMRSAGEIFPKKHGEWIRKKLYGDLWLTMDTWNKSITVVRGECNYDNMYTGFKDYVEKDYLGIDFGGFEVKVDVGRLNYYHELGRLSK